MCYMLIVRGPYILWHFFQRNLLRYSLFTNYPNEFQVVLYGKVKGEIVILLDHIFTRWIKNGICCAPNIREDYLTNKGWDFKCIPNGSSSLFGSIMTMKNQNIEKNLD